MFLINENHSIQEEDKHNYSKSSNIQEPSLLQSTRQLHTFKESREQGKEMGDREDVTPGT